MRNAFDAHMALCATHDARKAHAAHVSRALARHKVQRAQVTRKDASPLWGLVFACIVGVLLAL